MTRPRTPETIVAPARAEVSAASDSLPGHLNNALAVLMLGNREHGTEPYATHAPIISYDAEVIAAVVARIRAALALLVSPPTSGARCTCVGGLHALTCTTAMRAARDGDAAVAAIRASTRAARGRASGDTGHPRASLQTLMTRKGNFLVFQNFHERPPAFLGFNGADSDRISTARRFGTREDALEVVEQLRVHMRSVECTVIEVSA